jgi:hypothetical protein
MRARPGGAPPELPVVESASRAEGGLLRDDRALRVPRNTAPGRHDVVVRLEGDHTAELVLGAVEVSPPAPLPPVVPPWRPVDAAFAGVKVAGYDLDGELRPGGRVRVAVHWIATEGLGDDLSAFVHLVDGSGKPLAQHDGPPCGGACPTSGWEPGDVLVDAHEMSLPPELAPGTYAIVVGLYDPRTGIRLPRSGDLVHEPNSARLGNVNLGP